jgi:hypothetical protein
MNPKNFTIQLDCNGLPVNGLMNTNWKEYATHATLASASHAAAAGTKHVITGIIVSTDLAGAVVEVKQGATVLQTFTMAVGVFGHNFASHLELAVNTAATVTVTGTAACYANIYGYSVEQIT